MNTPGTADDPQQAAFAALQAVAEDMLASGRRCHAAAAKPAMGLRLSGFDEHALGFKNSRDFLAAAEEAGFVKLAFVRRGDVTVMPPGSDVPSLVIEQNRKRPKIRKDLWNAVVDIRTGQTWSLDRRTDTVVSSTGVDNHEGVVPIPVADGPTQIEWINAFVDSQDPGQGERLRTELETSTSPIDKIRAMGAVAETRGAWYDFRAKKVEEVLHQWKAEHDLKIDIFQPPSTRTATRKPAATPPREQADREVRARLHRAIDRMPLSDLLRISLPIEYTIDR